MLGGAGAADAGAAGAEASSAGLEGEAWVRLELSKPRRLCQLRLFLPAGAAARPRRCCLAASCDQAGGQSGVLVDVCEFDCGVGGGGDSSGGDEGGGGGGEWRSFGFYRPYKSKRIRVRVRVRGQG